MTFATAIQSLIGTNTPEGNGSFAAPDWTRNEVYIGGGSPTGGAATLARVGLITGLQEAFSPVSTYGSNDMPIGLDQSGNVYLPLGGLHSGGVAQISGPTLGLLSSASYPTNDFGAGGFAGVLCGSTQYMLDTGVGGGIIGTLSEINIIQGTTWKTNEEWSQGRTSFVCPGKFGTFKGYLLTTPGQASDTQSLALVACTCYPSQSFTAVGTIVPTAVDAGWTQIYANGMCLDNTDGNLLVTVNGQSGATNPNYLIKVNVATAAVVWVSAIPVSAGGSSVLGGITMGFSSVAHQQYSILTASTFGSPPNTITTFNTSTGSSTSQTTGLNGLTIFGQQAYNDHIGGIVCYVQLASTSGSPTLLNSTPSNFTGWAVLYVTNPIGPTIATGTHATQLRIWGNYH